MLTLFDKSETPIGRLKHDELADCIQEEPLNGITKLLFTVDFESKEKLEGAEYVGHVDGDYFQMYKLVSDIPTNEGLYYTAIHVAHDDLNSYGYIRDRRLGGVQAATALSVALGGSRWEVGRTVSTKASSVNFYDVSRKEAVSKILETWDVELGYRLVFDKNKIVKRYIDIYHKRGVDTGYRYVYGSNALEVVKESTQAGLYTAIIPRGRGEEKYSDEGTPTGGFGRRLQITDEVFSKARGDEFDKPKGQEYIELPEMTKRFGYSDGTPRFKVEVYQDIEDPRELALKAYEDLVKNSRPLVHLKTTIDNDKPLNLGDKVNIIRHDLSIYYSARVFLVKKDLLNDSIIDTELGDNLKFTQADFNKSLSKEIQANKEQAEESRSNAVEALSSAIVNSMYNNDAYNYRFRAGNKYDLPPGDYTFNRPIDENPTKVMFIGGGVFAIANKKNSDNSWQWSTFGTGDGFVADLITTGTLNANLIKSGVLSDLTGSFYLELETGAMNIGDVITYDPIGKKMQITLVDDLAKETESKIEQTTSSIESKISDTANNLQSQIRQNKDSIDLKVNANGVISAINLSRETAKIQGRNITLDGNVTMTSSFTVPQGNIGLLSADKIRGGTIDADYINVKNLNAGNLSSGTLQRPYDYGALSNGTNFNLYDRYVTIRDTGGRAEIKANGTVAAIGSGYAYEMNAGGFYGENTSMLALRSDGAANFMGRMISFRVADDGTRYLGW